MFPPSSIPQAGRFLWTAAALLAATAALAAPSSQKGRKAAPTAQAAAPKQENQFVTVEEFVKARRPPRTVVSVEGYIVMGGRASDGCLRLALVDSVDHVLNPKDADKMAAAGAKATVSAPALRKNPRWAWTAKGMQRFVMYAGAVRAQKALHDTVPKVRLTGQTAPGKGVLTPVTKIEFQDENGDWKKL
jgi:hypothetical protein